LVDIDAPELAQPHGPASRDLLAALLVGNTLNPALIHHPRVGRTVPGPPRACPCMVEEGKPTPPAFHQSCTTTCTRRGGDATPYHPSRPPAITLQSHGRDRYNRTLVTIFAAGNNINVAIVRTGHAWRYRYARKTGPIAEAEALARAEGRGLWARDTAVAPWEFRSGRGALSAETKH
jgi:hypothetical protein